MSAGDILIIDDKPSNLDLLVGILEGQGYDVRVATSGRRALAAARAAAPDLILLDIDMPEMSGYEVCDRLKADPSTADVPVIFLSVLDAVFDKVRAFRVGGVDYVTKPFQSEEVVARVETQLKIARLRRDLERRNVELAEANRVANEARQRALEASHAKSIFLANMSHELRTPLNGILGFVQLLERDPSLNDRHRERLAVISRSGEHLLGLINDVLSISKIESGQVTPNEQTFDLRRLLEGIDEMFRMRMQAKGLHFLVEVDEGVPRYAHGDDGKLRQVLINLLGNAVKFTESGGVALRVKWLDGVLEVEVEDTGPGIAAAELAVLFEPFVQTETGRRAREGSGLGLAISRNFVRLMGGDIRARSEVGAGTTFGFSVRLDEADASEIEIVTRRVVALEPGQPVFRILVVDDKSENRAILMDLLPPLGFEVREAADGREAVRVWEEWRPHLVWMDIEMPEIDGYEATRAIRQFEERLGKDTKVTTAAGTSGRSQSGVVSSLPRTKIVALSASVFEDDRRSIVDAGCDDFVAKPFRASTIFDKIAMHLGARFIYESATYSHAPADEVLTPEKLCSLSHESRERLHQAVTAGDVEEAYRAVDAISEVDPSVAGELRALVKGYRFDEILFLVENAS